MPDRQLPHYVKWVRYYFDFLEKYVPEGSREQKVYAFDRKLQAKRQSASLRAQARRAVELFLGMGEGEAFGSVDDSLVVSEEAAKRPASPTRRSSKKVPEVETGGWLEAIEAMGAEIRRLNYSPKTLSSYRKWVFRFREFCSPVSISDVSDVHAKDFLTDLAVNGKVVQVQDIGNTFG